MAYLITTEDLKPSIGEGSGQELPFLLVLSRSESGAYRLETLEAWLVRRTMVQKDALIHRFFTDGENRYPSDTC